MSYICDMKLTKKIKDKIGTWFGSKSPEEVYEISKKYGIDENPECICNSNISGYCHKHHTTWI